jgi:hypothetical protein
MAKSPEQLAHEQWLGYIQPEGLVVSIPALLEARAHINQNFLPRHRALLEFLPKDRAGQPIGELPGFLPFAQAILGWSQADVAGSPQGPALPDTLQFYLRDYGETLQPTYAVRDSAQEDEEWMLLIVSRQNRIGAYRNVINRSVAACRKSNAYRVIRTKGPLPTTAGRRNHRTASICGGLTQCDLRFGA